MATRMKFFAEAHQSARLVRSQDTEELYNDQRLQTNRQREECESWRDSIAEAMWVQYVGTLEQRYG